MDSFIPTQPLSLWESSSPPRSNQMSLNQPLKVNPLERYHSADDAHQKRTCNRTSTAELKRWLIEHKNNPYPTKGEKSCLAKATNLSLTQVSTWFANARRRLKKEPRIPVYSPEWSTSGLFYGCNGFTYQMPINACCYPQRLQYQLLLSSQSLQFPVGASRLLEMHKNDEIKREMADSIDQSIEDNGRKRAVESTFDSESASKPKRKKIWSVEDMISHDK